jgi:DNA-binding NtrC family response regulator
VLDQVIHVSLLGQDSGLAEAIGRALGEGFVTRVSDELQFSRLGEIREWSDVILLDLRTASTRGDTSGAIQLLDEMGKNPSQPPVVALCDAENRALLLGVMDHGAYDSVTSPPNMIEVRLVLRRAYKFHVAQREVERLRDNARSAGRLHELLGTSPAMQELFALAQKIAPCDVNVLITGETGTGKELLARAIHQMSARNARPLIAFSCANLPETLIEDELFGHEKGAFTGALTPRRGRLEAADSGTLFLDEIGDLGLGLQPNLLRVLQERTFERLGSNSTISVNIRLICATNRNLAEMVQQTKFREDLYYRLNVVQMHLPPLRERRDDIPLLAQHFLQSYAEQFKKKAKKFSQSALHAMEEYAWPGNVRELVNAVQRAVVLSDGPMVEVWQLPSSIRSTGEGPEFVRSYEEEVRQFKRRLVLRTLRECGWRKAESARTLGVARGYLHRLINQLGIQQVEEDSTAEKVEKPKQEKLPPVGIM